MNNDKSLLNLENIYFELCYNLLIYENLGK